MSLFSAIGDAAGGAWHAITSNPISSAVGAAAGAAWDAGKTAVNYTLYRPFVYATSFARRAYTDVISHPLATVGYMAAQAEYMESHHQAGWGDFFSKAGYSPFNPSTWETAWQQGDHVSPGQALIGAINNGLPSSNGNGQINMKLLSQYQADPTNPNYKGLNDPFLHGWGKVLSGSTDLMLGFKLDPIAKAGSMAGKSAKFLANKPIGSLHDVNAAMDRPSTAKFLNWTEDKSAAQIAEHPMLKDSPLRFKTAALLAEAPTTDLKALVLRSIWGDMRVLNAMERMPEGENVAFGLLHAASKEATAEALAIAPQDFDTMDQMIQTIKSASTSEAETMDKVYQWRKALMDAHATNIYNTGNSSLRQLAAGAKFGLKFGERTDTTPLEFQTGGISSFFKKMNHVPVRLIQPFYDKAPNGFLDFNDDNSTEMLRGWLNRSRALTTDEKNDLVSKYATATPQARQAAWDDIRAQRYNAIARKFGMSSDHIKDIEGEFTKRGKTLVQNVASRRYSTAKFDDGTYVDAVPSDDGELVVRPLWANQLARGSQLMDNLDSLERSLTSLNRDGRLGTIMRMGDKGRGYLMDALDNYYGVWKPSELLHIHRMYNHIGDDLIHSTAKMGAAATISNIKGGAANFLRNRYRSLTRGQWIRNIDGQQETVYKSYVAERDVLHARFDDQQARIKGGENIPLEERVSKDELNAFDKRVNDYTKGLRPSNTRSFTGTFHIPGTNMEVADLFGGPGENDNAYLRSIFSSDPWIHALMGDGSLKREAELLKGYYSEHGHGTVFGSDPGHMTSWVNAINNMIRTDPVGKMHLNGQSLDSVEKWLRDSSSGRAHMDKLIKADEHAHALATYETVRKYLPTQALRDIAKTRPVTAQDLQRAIPDASKRPEVDGELLAMNSGKHSVLESFRGVRDKWMKITGTLPDDILGRHPFAAQMYRQHVSDLAKLYKSQTGHLTVGDINDVIRPKAILMARKDVQSTLYDASRFTDAGHALRFISPFFNAWWNAIGTWSKMFRDNPGLVERASWAYNGMQRDFPTVDMTTGQPADPNTPEENRAFLLQIPEPVANAISKAVGIDMNQMRNIEIPISSITSVVYGDRPLVPGLGPIVAVPANYMALKNPNLLTDDYVNNYLGGYFDAKPLQQAVPALFQPLFGMVSDGGNGLETATASKMALNIYQGEYIDYLEGRRADMPTLSDAEKQSTMMSALNTFVKFVSPLGYTPKSTYSFYIDQATQMESADPVNWQTNFYNKYGKNLFVLTASLNKNVAGIPATMNAITAYKKYKTIIDQDPQIAGVVVGPEGNGAFSYGAYDWEKFMGMRTSLTPEQAIQQNNVDLGWISFDKVDNFVKLQLGLRGLVSTSQSGAADLRTLKDGFIQLTGTPGSSYYNPDWYNSYGSYNQNQQESNVVALRQIAQDPSLLANPARADIRALNVYFQIRDNVQAQLAQRKASGGSGTITSTSNQDLASWWDYWVNSLQQETTTFGPIWNRYLRQDNFTIP